MVKSAQKAGVIIQGSGLNALGVVRSLAVERVDIAVIDEKPGGPAVHSRHARPRLFEPAASDSEASFIRALSELAAVFEQPPVLILTQEAAVASVSKHRERLAKRLRMQLPDAPTLADLMDKTGFQRRAEALGLPVPRSVVVGGAADLQAAALLTYPCVLKPALKSDRWEQHYKKAYRFDDFAALAFFWRSAERAPPVIVQEWIEGTDSDVYFTLVQRDIGGRTCASFTGRKIRQWPPLVGGTASCMPAPEAAAELHDLTTRFFDAVGVIGLASIEFKRHRRDGRFVMVEPTLGRTDYQEEVATLNGVNVVRAAYRSMAGLPDAVERPARGVTIWRDSLSDAKSREALALPTPPATVGARVVDALYRSGDPGPWLMGQVERVANRVARFLR